MHIFPWLPCLTWLRAWASLSVFSSGPGSLADLSFLQGMFSRVAVGQLGVVEGFTVGWHTVGKGAGGSSGQAVWPCCSSLPQHPVMFAKGDLKILIRLTEPAYLKRKFLKWYNNVSRDWVVPCRSRRKRKLLCLWQWELTVVWLSKYMKCEIFIFAIQGEKNKWKLDSTVDYNLLRGEHTQVIY